MYLIIISCVLVIIFEVGIFLLRKGNVQGFILLNIINSKFIALLALLSLYFRESSILDIAFLYLALSMVAPIALWLYYIYSTNSGKKIDHHLSSEERKKLP